MASEDKGRAKIIQLRKEILNLQKDMGFTLLYVTHDLQKAFSIATRLVIMKEGRVVRKRTIEEVKSYFNERIVSMRRGK